MSDFREVLKGRRIFAVDGSKLNLPRELLGLGYGLPTPTSYRPQGLAIKDLNLDMPVI